MANISRRTVLKTGVASLLPAAVAQAQGSGAARRPILKRVDWPSFGPVRHPAPASKEEFQSRVDRARQEMLRRGLTHLVVYGDREHFANLTYLCGIDPRFEEALLILGEARSPLLLVGNECWGYLGHSPLWRDKALRAELFQPLSLPNEPRGHSRLLREILAEEGIAGTAKVGCCGWKYYSDREDPEGRFAIDAPAYVVDTLRRLAAHDRVTNATGIFNDPDSGLRTFCSAAEIAYFEFTNTLASDGMTGMLHAIRDGALDYDVARAAGYNGEPLGCHMTVNTGDPLSFGLSSPMGSTVRRGDPLSLNICYWGSNVCRSGWVARSAQDLPSGARDYAEVFAGPYFAAMSEWVRLLRPGQPGAALNDAIQSRLPFDRFGITLNPGHLIHLEEWLSSPIFPGSSIRLHSGMVMQADVIPSSPTYASSRVEDGYAIADTALQASIKRDYPECHARCLKRREFMRTVLGIDVPHEVLPLANMAGCIPPFFLDPHLVFALEA